MQAYRSVGFILAMTGLCLLVTRHVYQAFIRDDASVLDRFDAQAAASAALRDEIKRIDTREDLVARYTAARERRDALNKELADKLREEFPASILTLPEQENDGAAPNASPDWGTPYSPRWKEYESSRNALPDEQKALEIRKAEYRRDFLRRHQAEYARAEGLEKAVRQWEAKSRELAETKTYWFIGLGLFAAGAVLFRWSAGLGLAFVTPGVLEMIWWACPSFGFSGAVAEDYRLLIARLTLSAVTLALLVAGYLLAPRWSRRRTGPAAAA